MTTVIDSETSRVTPSRAGFGLRGRLHPRTLKAGAVGLLACLAVFTLLLREQPPLRVVVAATDIAAGTALSADMLTIQEVPASDVIRNTALLGRTPDSLQGKVAARDLQGGQMLTVGDVSSAQPMAAGHRLLHLPVDAEFAVAGDLHAGDRIDVIEVRDGTAHYVASTLQVIDVVAPSDDATPATRSFGVTVAVNDHVALRIAAALVDGRVFITRTNDTRPSSAEAFSRTPSSAAPAGPQDPQP